MSDRRHTLSPIGDHPEYLIPTKTDWERRVKVWREFGPWFRENGIFRNKCAHECRKFFGAQVATQQGIYVASKLLGRRVRGWVALTLIYIKWPQLTHLYCLNNAPINCPPPNEEPLELASSFCIGIVQIGHC
jgi:hypothetical protein